MTRDDAKTGPQRGSSADAPDEKQQVAVRRAKLQAWRLAGSAFPNDFRPDSSCSDLVTRFADHDSDRLEEESGRYSLGGRIVAIRSFGKSAFLVLRDGRGRLQLFADKKTLGDTGYAVVRGLDLGDIVAVKGGLFRTRKGELTLRCDDLRLLAKALRPPPEKWHGLTDIETRYRQRYVDLIASAKVAETFRARAAVVAGMRRFLDERGFLEVETPMMQPVAGGAVARPFVTHHNTLAMDLFLRVAPELYLKRLLVGGFERVYERNRNFRNEGVSTQHNPEFTMCEFYQAYAAYEDLMDLTEQLLAGLATSTCGGTRVVYQGRELDFSAPFERMSMAEAVVRHSDLGPDTVLDRSALESEADRLGIEPAKRKPGLGLLADVFEQVAEESLVQPTFITDFPVEVSPLARLQDADPRFVDRFELYIAGREIANGFSELNDPEDQERRFRDQLSRREAGDDEAHRMDEDYICALEYAMPPAAGEGIGIDRLVMLLTDSPSIRDVILFPQLKRPARS